jgi:hypothetical protein
MADNTFIKIHDAEIVNDTIVIKKIIILDDCDKIIREATMNKDLLSLLKNMQFSTKFALIKKEFDKDLTDPLQQLKPNDNPS